MVEESTSDRRREERVTGRHNSHAGDQFGRRRALQQESARAGSQSLIDVLVEIERRQDDHARRALVVAQVALAAVLLVASGLMVRTFLSIRDVPPGFVRPEEVLTFRVSIPQAVVADNAQTARLHEEIAYVAYHFHWGLDEIIDLEHPTRRRFVEEIAKINRRLAENDEDG